MEKRTKVCHVTSVHRAFDGRIFKKECRSLAARYDVYLIAPNIPDQVVDGVSLIGIPLPKSRIKRLFNLSKVYKAVLCINADVYHFHDPELIPIAKRMKKNGKKVIFDSHEDIPSDILEKKYIPKPLRKVISLVYSLYEKRAFRLFDAIVSVTPTIVNRLRGYNPMTFQITNYPIYKDIPSAQSRGNYICFTGAISKTWRIDTIIRSLDKIETEFIIAGPLRDSYREEIAQLESWSKVEYRGFVNPDEVEDIQKKAYAGIAVLMYGDLYGGTTGTLGNTKLFEYMMCGTPVIATDFSLWKDIIESYQCGICVNPYDTNSIAETIGYLKRNPAIVQKMGENGKRAVKEKYNWSTQESILFELYDMILKNTKK